MDVKTIIPRLSFLRKEYRKFAQEANHKNDLYTQKLHRFGCDLCPRFRQEVNGIPLALRHQHCSPCSHQKEIAEALQEVLDARAAWDRFNKVIYGKAIFESWSVAQPSFIDQRDGKCLSFDAAFGSSYESVVANGKYKILVSLLEEPVSVYSLC